jgi:hypothetical protein
MGGVKGLSQDRQKDVYRLMHIAYDHGYLFDGVEMEEAWFLVNKGWAPLPESDLATWKILQKSLPATLVGSQHPDFKLI